jgi:hypothetical protein
VFNSSFVGTGYLDLNLGFRAELLFKRNLRKNILIETSEMEKKAWKLQQAFHMCKQLMAM